MAEPCLDVEQELADQGFDVIVGFDEVGRGALAGPVMVGAAAFWARDVGQLDIPRGLRDSKMLTERQREALFDPLQGWCAANAVGQSSNKEIDAWGISYALGVAALRALNEVERQLAIRGVKASGAVTVGAILDGPHDYISKAFGTFDAPAVAVRPAVRTRVKADQYCAAVSAASVIAKVTRDRLMVSIVQGNPRYQPYRWAQNKGYGSAAHRAAIRRFGATDLHRRSWHLC